MADDLRLAIEGEKAFDEALGLIESSKIVDISKLPDELPDGIYLNLPMPAYIRCRGLSGSGFKKLSGSAPEDYAWDDPDNPLRENAESEPKFRGTAVHKAILEGLDAYNLDYCPTPDISKFPGALVTQKDIAEWLESKGVRKSGSKPELIARALAHDPDAPIWDVIKMDCLSGRTEIKPKAHASIQLLERVVRTDPLIKPLLTGGIAELTIIKTVGGVKFKCRLDQLVKDAVVDAKKYGVAPRPDKTLTQHCLAEAVKYGYPIQAVHNTNMIEAAVELLDAGLVYECGDGELAAPDGGDLELLREIIPGPKKFYWLFVRTPGPPTCIAIEFVRGTPRWERAHSRILKAIDVFHEWSARFPEGGLWLRSDGVVTPNDEDWPAYD